MVVDDIAIPYLANVKGQWRRSFLRRPPHRFRQRKANNQPLHFTSDNETLHSTNLGVFDLKLLDFLCYIHRRTLGVYFSLKL
jgi:hypothetical protein